MTDLNWDDLLDDLDDQLCILFIGPDIVQVDGRPLNEAMRHYVKAQCPPDQILHYYERDGFFLFRDGTAKTNARRYIKRFFRDHTFGEDVFRKIIAIPFPLVVSINADTMLDDVAYKHGVRHRFSYFKNRSRAAEAVEAPSAAEPLFYNLCGCKNQDDSLLLDYEDLFQLLQSALGSPGLPQKLLEAFGNARTFLFLGFQFDKWHTQLLLRLLQGDRADVSSYVIRPPLPTQENSATKLGDPAAQAIESYKQALESDTQAFLVSQFNINFLGDQADFFEALYQRCAKAGKLRKLGDPLSTEATEIIRDIQNNKIPEALELLNRQAEERGSEDLKTTATMLTSQFNYLSGQIEKGTIDSRDANVQRNRILDTILETVKKFNGAR